MQGREKPFERRHTKWTGCAALPTTADWKAGAERIWKQGAALRGTNQQARLKNETEWQKEPKLSGWLLPLHSEMFKQTKLFFPFCLGCCFFIDVHFLRRFPIVSRRACCCILVVSTCNFTSSATFLSVWQITLCTETGKAKSAEKTAANETLCDVLVLQGSIITPKWYDCTATACQSVTCTRFWC